MYTDLEKELVAFIRAVKVNPDAKVIIRKYPYTKGMLKLLREPYKSL